MPRDDITLVIEWNSRTNSFTTGGNASLQGRMEIAEHYLRSTLSSGEDKRKPNEIEVYTVRMDLDLDDDILRVRSDTGNNGLTTGIVYDYFTRLQKDHCSA